MTLNNVQFDPEAIKLLLTIPSFIGAIVALFQLSVMRHRNKLKFDLEMLKHYKEIDATSQFYQDMKLRAERRIQALYPSPDQIRTDLDRSDILWGCLLIIAGVLTLSYEKTGFFYGVAIGCILAGVVGIYKGFERKIRYYLLGKGKKSKKQVDSLELVGSAAE